MFLVFCFLPYFWLLFVSRSFRLDHSHQCMNKTNNNRSPFTNISETSREILIFFSNLLWQQQILHWCVARSLATRKQRVLWRHYFVRKYMTILSLRTVLQICSSPARLSLDASSLELQGIREPALEIKPITVHEKLKDFTVWGKDVVMRSVTNLFWLCYS